MIHEAFLLLPSHHVYPCCDLLGYKLTLDWHRKATQLCQAWE